MRKIIVLLVFVTFIFGCKNGLTNNEQKALQSKIDFHNLTVHGKFSLDSIDELFKLKEFYLPASKLDPQIESMNNQIIESKMSTFTNDWNKPYSLQKDYKLTIDSYLKYCTTMNYDSKTYIEIVDK